MSPPDLRYRSQHISPPASTPAPVCITTFTSVTCDQFNFYFYQAGRDEFELIRLAEDALLCEFDPWFRGLSWDSYRQFAPK